MIEMVKEAKDSTGLDTKAVCRTGGLPYSSIRRWAGRLDAGLPLVLPRGPRPVGPLDLGGLLGRILAMHHGRKRTQGTGDLVAAYKGKASRRRVLAMVAEVREVRNRQEDESLRQLEWLHPGSVWTSDTTEIDIPGFGKIYAQTIRDLASRHLMIPALDHEPTGAEVAACLEPQFRAHGAPLVIKFDNGAILRSKEMIDLLDRWLVIPLYSPKAYPQYNGSVEESQGEIQAAFAAFLARNPGWRPEMPGYPEERDTRVSDRTPPASQPVAAQPGKPNILWLIETVADNVAQSLNHNDRDVLRGICSCRVFNPGRKRSMFTRRYRKEVADTLAHNAATILGGIADPTPAQAAKAWRLAAEQWLFDAGFVTEKAS